MGDQARICVKDYEKEGVWQLVYFVIVFVDDGGGENRLDDDECGCGVVGDRGEDDDVDSGDRCEGESGWW